MSVFRPTYCTVGDDRGITIDLTRMSLICHGYQGDGDDGDMLGCHWCVSAHLQHTSSSFSGCVDRGYQCPGWHIEDRGHIHTGQAEPGKHQSRIKSIPADPDSWLTVRQSQARPGPARSAISPVPGLLLPVPASLPWQVTNARRLLYYFLYFIDIRNKEIMNTIHNKLMTMLAGLMTSLVKTRA